MGLPSTSRYSCGDRGDGVTPGPCTRCLVMPRSQITAQHWVPRVHHPWVLPPPGAAPGAVAAAGNIRGELLQQESPSRGADVPARRCSLCSVLGKQQGRGLQTRAAPGSHLSPRGVWGPCWEPHKVVPGKGKGQRVLQRMTYSSGIMLFASILGLCSTLGCLGRAALPAATCQHPASPAC